MEVTTASPMRRRWRRYAYPLFILLFTIVAGELAARWYLTHVMEKSSQKKFRFSYYRVYEHVPGYREVKLEDGNYRMTINTGGFRRRTDVALSKPDSVYRIFLMGGSAAHGVSSSKPFPVRHLADDETIDAVLERSLNEGRHGNHVEVINAAVTGYQVFQHTAYLQSELLAYDPDLVIFFDGANDHYVNNSDERYLLDYRFQFWKERLQDPSLSGGFTYMANWLAEYSSMFKAYMVWALERDAKARWKSAPAYEKFENDSDRIAAHRRTAPQQFLRSLHMNLDLLQREGVEAIVCLQPMLVLRDSARWSPEERALGWHDHNVQALYPVVQSEVAEVAREHRVPFVDMNPVCNDASLAGRQFFIDDCHLTPLGADQCARALMPWIDGLMTPVEVPDTAGISAPAQ